MNRPKKSQKKKTAAAATKVAKAVVNAITHSSPGPKKQKKKRNRKRKLGNNLLNHPGGTGRLGLSSINRSSTRLKQMIEEDEYIADINGSVAFATNAFNVNIGQSSTFPWGSKIAALFEKYHFDMLEFYYRREVSEYATNGQSGKVMLSFDYDASDAAPTSKQQVLDTIPHADAMPCEPTVVLRINTNEMKSQDGWYVRSGAQPANTDIKTYDCGILYVSTYGCANTTAIGELRVRYKCTLHVPVLEASGGAASSAGSYFEITSPLIGEVSAATTVYDTQFASATNPVVIANSIGATIANTGLITLNPGVYKMEFAATTWATTAASSQSNIGVFQSATANTNKVIATNNGGFSTTANTALGYTAFNPGGLVDPFIWNTTLFGVTVALQVNNTYASGTGYNNSYFKITQL